MKQKLTITVEESLIPKAKRLARAQGMSLSELVERRLLELLDVEGTPDSFSNRWRGRMRLKSSSDARARRLRAKNK
ncbi:MAG: DUF6364 family protein [Myxococcota bacterium]